MLALSPGTAYIHGPFHPNCRPGTSVGPFEHWYTYVVGELEEEYRASLERTLGFRYSYREELVALESVRDAARMVRDVGRWALYRVRNARPIMKDPIAVFSTEWLAETFAIDVLFLVRHPAAFASSLIRLGWTTDFNEFLAQPELIATHLEEFAEDIESAAADPPSLIDQAILLWRMIYAPAHGLAVQHPDWLFMRHEDISRDPVRMFDQAYSRLGLTLTDAAHRSILAHSDGSNPDAAPGDQVHLLKRNSAANVSGWKTKLREDEIRRIRVGVESGSSEFYGDEDW